jgi:hypothetical protein
MNCYPLFFTPKKNDDKRVPKGFKFCFSFSFIDLEKQFFFFLNGHVYHIEFLHIKNDGQEHMESKIAMW